MQKITRDAGKLIPPSHNSTTLNTMLIAINVKP
jgi:hypothetical protein